MGAIGAAGAVGATSAFAGVGTGEGVFMVLFLSWSGR
jgi:hypothetical protein